MSEQLQLVPVNNQEVAIPEKPKKGQLAEWSQDKLAEDAGELYDGLKSALLANLEVRVDDKGKVIPPNIRAIEVAAEILKLKGDGGISITQNIGNTINNGPVVTIDDIIRRQQARDRKEPAIDVEFVEVKDEKRPNGASK